MRLRQFSHNIKHLAFCGNIAGLFCLFSMAEQETSEWILDYLSVALEPTNSNKFQSSVGLEMHLFICAVVSAIEDMELDKHIGVW